MRDLLRRRCGGVRRYAATGLLLLLPVTTVACPPTDGGVRGQVYANIACYADGSIQWSGHVSEFIPSARVRYHWMIFMNGDHLISGQSSGTYWTDRFGNHFRLPRGFPQSLDCEPGHYSILLWVVGESPNSVGWQSSAGAAETVCM